MLSRAEELVRLLDLRPHPEGGAFRMLDRAPEARSAIERAAPELLRLA